MLETHLAARLHQKKSKEAARHLMLPREMELLAKN